MVQSVVITTGTVLYLALAGGFVLGQEDPGDVTEWFEELLQIILLGTLRQVAHPEVENIQRSHIKIQANVGLVVLFDIDEVYESYRTDTTRKCGR